MKLIEDQKPRRDHLVEAMGTWGEITVGTRMALTSDRTNVWEVVDTKSPDQWEYGRTCWFQVVEVNTGELRAVRPKLVNSRCRILLTSADQQLPARRPVGDAETVLMLLESILGKTNEVYTQDVASGEVWCPWDPHKGPDGMFRHLHEAHEIDTGAIEAILDVPARMAAMHTLHGQAHNPKYAISRGGFSHRHVPEDLKIL